MESRACTERQRQHRYRYLDTQPLPQAHHAAKHEYHQRVPQLSLADRPQRRGYKSPHRPLQPLDRCATVCLPQQADGTWFGVELFDNKRKEIDMLVTKQLSCSIKSG